MKVYPDPFEIGDLEGFSLGRDLFRRRDFASGMSRIVSSVQDPLVIAFDGEWGSGKTTFLKMWAGELRKAGHPVILFDAFENDYVEDAFAALVREIVELIDDNTPIDSRIGATFKQNAVKLAALFLRSSAQIGVKVAVRSLTAGLVNSEDFKEIGKDVSDVVESASNEYIKELLSDPQKQKDMIIQFRSSLQNLPSLLQLKTENSTDDKSLPLVFIVDELDRCKPPFALAILERIKHFMSVPNVHFVLGVHMEQLENSVRYAYGNSIDANAYLQRFISFTIFNFSDLESSRHHDLHHHARYLSKTLSIGGEHDSVLKAAIEVVIRVLQLENQSFRSLERAFTILAFGLGYDKRVQPEIGEVIGGLVVMKLRRPSLFKKAKMGTLKIEEVRDFLRFSQADSFLDMSVEEKWWAFIFSEPLSAELTEFQETIPDDIKGFGNRKKLVQYIANHIIDRSTS